MLISFTFCLTCVGQESHVNTSMIAAAIDSMFQKDAESLRKARELRENYGMQSEEAKKQDSLSHLIQANNVLELDKLLERYGWPGEDEIGEDAGYSLFGIIQHSSMNTRPKYLPIMREAVKNGKCRPGYLAGIEDRIATDNNELQIYGDQVKYYPDTNTFDVWPIIDPAHVDERRASIGLQPIAIHLKNRFDMDWDLEKQVARTKEFLERKKGQ